jgi:DNA modification methylase
MVLAKKKEAAVEANGGPSLFWESPRGWVRLYQGDVREALALLPARSVHCVVTSPPYWGLRDYGTGTWEGGDPACDHASGRSNDIAAASPCSKCGARRVDRQIGSEPSPDCGTRGQAQCGGCFVCTMVAVFREVRRVLRDDGTLFLNLGDTYSGGKSGRDDSGDNGRFAGPRIDPTPRKPTQGLPSGNLVGVPWRVALALQADGWVLRQDIIWAKPSPMPESVRNRCTKAHEYVFLLTKSNRYFYDAEAIRETAEYGYRDMPNGDLYAHNEERQPGSTTGKHPEYGRNKRSVWSVASQGFPGAHFATFPPNLIRPMILAGTSERGCCASCGAPWRRVTEERKLTRERPNDYVKRTGEEGTGNSCANTVAGVEVSTIGWVPTCECCGLSLINDPPGEPSKRKDEDTAAFLSRFRSWEIKLAEWYSEWGAAKPVLAAQTLSQCVVLDPFVGSGTVLEVAAEEGRRAVGIDLSADYLRKFAVRRAEEALKKLRDPGTGLWVIDGHARPVVEAPSARGPSTVRRIV